MNYLAIKNNVTQNLGGRTDIANFLSDWINNTIVDFVTRSKFPELGVFAPLKIPELEDTDTFTLSADDYDQAMPSQVMFLITLKDTTNDQILKQRDIHWFDRNRTTTSSNPTTYCVFEDTIFVDPPPVASTVIQWRGRKKIDIPELAADADIPVIGEELHEGLEIGATWRGAIRLKRSDKIDWYNAYREFITAHAEQRTAELEDYDKGFSIVM